MKLIVGTFLPTHMQMLLLHNSTDVTPLHVFAVLQILAPLTAQQFDT